jgi:hypothetical protein
VFLDENKNDVHIMMARSDGQTGSALSSDGVARHEAVEEMGSGVCDGMY